MSLIESICFVEKSGDKLDKTHEHLRKIIKNKFAKIIEKNSGFQTLNIARDIVENQQAS